MTDQAKTSAIQGGKQFHSRAWNRLLLFLCLFQFTSILAFVCLTPWRSKGPAPVIISTNIFPDGPYTKGQPGPWGDLEFIRVHIEPPVEFLPVDGRIFPRTQWYFPGYTREKLTAFLHAASLTVEQEASLLKATWLMDQANGLILEPSAKTILSLGPVSRQKIYIELSRSERNSFQYAPYLYPNGTFEDWLGDSALPAATMEWLKKLVYQHGNSLCFSDLPELFALTPDIKDQKRLVKALSRNATILMKLEVHTNSDPVKLTAYWGRGKRAKDITPLLDSLTDVPGGMTVDVLQLLPPLGRKLMNTYPIYSPTNREVMPDCYWTAMNFFNDPPDNRYLDFACCQKDLMENYEGITDPQLGDVILLTVAGATPIHAAVFIADDVVFTKNGGNYRQPWILMRMKDMLARYTGNDDIQIHYFRQKRFLAAGEL